MPVTISGSTGISGVDGSAGTPALIGSDADTGIFLAAGQVSASVNGTAGNVPLVSGTAQASTSGTSIDFTSIPSWVKRVTVMFNGVSTNGTSIPIIQLGAGSITSTGYSGGTGYAVNAAASVVTAQTTGFGLTGAASSSSSVTGNAVITLSGSNTWIFNISGYQVSNAAISGGGTITLSGTLDRIRITTVNGTDTFDAGSINIMYE